MNSKVKLPAELDAHLFQEIQRQMDWLVGVVNKWPAYRATVCAELLGGAIGAADCFGCDAQETLDDIRAECGTAGELIPPDVS